MLIDPGIGNYMSSTLRIFELILAGRI